MSGGLIEFARFLFGVATTTPALLLVMSRIANIGFTGVLGEIVAYYSAAV